MMRRTCGPTSWTGRPVGKASGITVAACSAPAAPPHPDEGVLPADNTQGTATVPYHLDRIAEAVKDDQTIHVVAGSRQTGSWR